MIDLDDVYYFKRTKSLIKLKVMSTIDLRVVGFEEGNNKNKGKLGAVLVKYKDGVDLNSLSADLAEIDLKFSINYVQAY